MKYLKYISHVYGPYTCKASGRRTVAVHLETGQERFVSYPKFLVEVIVGRALDPKTETIDHIDGDFNNNSWSNLRILTKEDHAREDALRIQLTPVTCVWCGESTYKRPNQIKHRGRKQLFGPFCSIHCRSVFSAEKQNGRLPEPLDYYRKWCAYKNVPVIKYRVDKGGETVADMASRVGLTLYAEEEILAALPRKKSHVKPKQIHPCEICGTPTKNKRFCSSECTGKAQQRTKWPTAEKMKQLVWKYPTSYIARRLGVSDVSVAKYCKKHGISKPPRGYWQCNRNE